MPSKTRKQHDLMEAVKHSPEFARKVGVSQKVAKEFLNADKKAGKFRPAKKKALTHLRNAKIIQ